MIKNRNSDEHLHTDIILSKITEYDIFKYYCLNFRDLGKKFCSDLRSDKTPTVAIVMWNNKLLYKSHNKFIFKNNKQFAREFTRLLKEQYRK